MLRLLTLTTLAVSLSLACSADVGDDGDLDVADEELTANHSLVDKCADPGAILEGGTYYVTCTGASFPIYASTSPTGGFQRVGHIFPDGKTPAWADGLFWAPEIHKVKGGFVAYFSARHKTTGKNAIGAAFSKNVTGPWVDRGSPIVAGDTSKIDAHMFTDPDGGKQYLFWKVERFRMVNGRSVGDDAIRAQQLSADGMSFASPQDAPTPIIESGLDWEDGVVEAPWVIKRGGFYYLFYSGSTYCNRNYAVGVARAKSPLGPWTKHGAPILVSGKNWVGPGHNSVVFGDGAWRIFFHAFHLTQGRPACRELPDDNDQRHLLSATLGFSDGWPKVGAHL